MRALVALWKDETGAAAAEYALVLAILGAALTFGALALGGAVTNEMKSATPNCASATMSPETRC